MISSLKIINAFGLPIRFADFIITSNPEIFHASLKKGVIVFSPSLSVTWLHYEGPTGATPTKTIEEFIHKSKKLYHHAISQTSENQKTNL